MEFYTGEQLEEPFSKEEFEAKWNEFIPTYQDRPNLYNALVNAPELLDEYKLRLIISSNTIDEEIKLIKPELISWLRKELRNTKIELETVVDVQQVVRQGYSDTEKLEAMIEKNPNLALLKQRFNLDFNQ